VKKPRILFGLHGFLLFASVYTNSAHLLRFRQELVWDVADRVLEQFWTTQGRGVMAATQ